MLGKRGWCVVVPVRPVARGKSRLAALGPMRNVLAQAIADDVVSALTFTPEVGAVMLAGDPSAFTVSAHLTTAQRDKLQLVDTGDLGLNEAAAYALQMAESSGYAHRAVVVSDLGCLVSADVSEVLRLARQYPTSFIPDHTGLGTTAIFSTHHHQVPRFGPGSAQRHAAHGAVKLTASMRMRLDIDTPADLSVAIGLGLATRSSQVLAPASQLF